MNRLQRKCVIASAGLHLLLALILFAGPGFLSSNTKVMDVKVLNFVPYQLVDQDITGGGRPNAPPPAVRQPEPTPAPQPKPPVVEPKPPEPEPPKPAVADKPTVKPSRRLPNVSTTPVVRRPSTTSNRTPSPDADAARRVALNRAIRRIENGVSSSTSFEDLPGPGGGGLPYAGYRQAVLSAYDRAWVAPAKIASSEAVVTVRVAFNQDGTVASAQIIKRSGDPDMDDSVQRTLDRVTTVGASFPENTTQAQRTFEFNFKSRTKLSG